MRFQANHPIDDVRPDFLQAPGPLDVTRLVKPRSKLNDGRDATVDVNADTGQVDRSKSERKG